MFIWDSHRTGVLRRVRPPCSEAAAASPKDTHPDVTSGSNREFRILQAHFVKMEQRTESEGWSIV